MPEPSQVYFLISMKICANRIDAAQKTPGRNSSPLRQQARSDPLQRRKGLAASVIAQIRVKRTETPRLVYPLRGYCAMRWRTSVPYHAASSMTCFATLSMMMGVSKYWNSG
jgi:hypothetical protein